MENVNFQGGHSKQNLPAFWEKRQESKFMIMVDLVCDHNMKPKFPCFINRLENIDKSFHVMFVTKVGDIIVRGMRFIKTNKLKFSFYLVTEISEGKKGKFTFHTEEQFSSDNIEDFVNEYGEDCRAVLNAAQDKMDSENKVETFFSAPNPSLQR